jgi:hypothetical protein
LLDKSKERLKGLRMSRTKLRLGVNKARKRQELCEQDAATTRNEETSIATRQQSTPAAADVPPLRHTIARRRRAAPRTNEQTDLKEDPNSGAEAGNGPRDEEEQDEPKDSEERVLGHGLKYYVKVERVD